MPQVPHWQDPAGLETINTIIKKVIPTWMNGLHAVQLDLVSAILDGKDVLCCTATSNGKSAAFSVPTLVILEYNKHLAAYVEGLPTWTRPIRAVVTPTKGLADNIAHELSKLNVSAFSYCKETLTSKESNITLFLDLEDQLKGEKVFTVYLGSMSMANGPNIPKYYSKPLVIKIARNGVDRRALEKEYSNYSLLSDQGIKSIAQVYALFTCAQVPGCKVLLMEHRGERISASSLLKPRKKSFSVNTLLNGLIAFHERNISIGNIMNDHVLIDERNNVKLISLAHVSFSPSDEEKSEDTNSFEDVLLSLKKTANSPELASD